MEEKREVIAELFDCYAPLLSDRQREVLDLYYNMDLSLGEIAEGMGITRQGVRDAIKHGEAFLYQTEEKIGLSSKLKRIKDIAQKIRVSTDSKAIQSLADSIIGGV